MTEAQVLCAFWHKGRRDFAEWTTTEIAKRCGDNEDNIGNRLGRMAARGIVDGKKLPTGNKMGWRLTKAGQQAAFAAMGIN